MSDKVKVTVRNTTNHIRVFTDEVGGEIQFAPGEVKAIEVSKAAADALKAGRAGWELTTAKAAAAAAPPAAAKPPAKLSRSDLEAMTKDELVSKAGELGVDVAQSWLKDEIIDAVFKGQK